MAATVRDHTALNAKRDVQIGRLTSREVFRELKTGRHDADDLPCPAVGNDLAADHVRRAAEPTTPESVAQDDHTAPGSIFLHREHPTEVWLDPE